MRTLTIDASGGKKVRVHAEIANTPAEQGQRLEYRTFLPEDHGMLFVFTSPQTLSFWAKNVSIPLSVAFIDSNGQIVDIQNMGPHTETVHRSKQPSQYALEVNRGFFEKHGSRIGDKVELPSSIESQSTTPDPAFDALLPTLQQMTTAPIMLPGELPPQLKNVAIGDDTSADKYTILFLGGKPQGIIQPYIHANTMGTLTAAPSSNHSSPPSSAAATVIGRGTATLPDGTKANLLTEQGPQWSNMGTLSIGTFEENGWTYTLTLSVGGTLPDDSTGKVLSTMVSVSR